MYLLSAKHLSVLDAIELCYERECGGYTCQTGHCPQDLHDVEYRQRKSDMQLEVVGQGKVFEAEIFPGLYP